MILDGKPHSGVSRRDLIKGPALVAASAAVDHAAFASTPKGKDQMSTIKTKDSTEIYYKDWGAGQPIVFSHGWPLSADDWDAQMLFFLERVLLPRQ